MRGWLTAQARPLSCSVPGCRRSTPHTARSTSSRWTTRTACRSRSASASRTSGTSIAPAGHAGVVAHALQRPFQLADVAAQLAREELQHLVGDRHAVGRAGLGAQDRQPRVAVGRRQAPDRPAEQAVGQLGAEVVGQPGVAVARQHHLPAVGQQGVEGVQELLLRRLLGRPGSAGRPRAGRPPRGTACGSPARRSCRMAWTKRLVKSSVVT